eukprot:SAG31_NODE_13550_length_862_cov_1.002621_1_plen_148_part_10
MRQCDRWVTRGDLRFRCTVAVAGCALLLLEAGASVPPTADAVDCTPWGCCCDGYADYFGSVAGKCMGCAPGNVSRWWGDHKCNTASASGRCCDGLACKLPGAPACTPPSTTGPLTVPNWKPTYRMNESTIVMPCDYQAYVSDTPGLRP